MLAKHSHTETKSTERQQRNPKLDTENITSNVISIIILSKTCRLIFAECFLLFFCFFSTYLLYIKSCKENSADRRSPWMRHSIPDQSQEEGERGREREREGERRGREGGGAGRQVHYSACQLKFSMK